MNEFEKASELLGYVTEAAPLSQEERDLYFFKSGTLAAAEISLQTLDHLASPIAPYNHGILDARDSIYKAIKAKAEEI